MANEKSTSKEVKEESISNKIIGEAYRDLKKLVKRYAHEDMPLLLMGESGTGKELFAKLYMKPLQGIAGVFSLKELRV